MRREQLKIRETRPKRISRAERLRLKAIDNAKTAIDPNAPAAERTKARKLKPLYRKAIGHAR